MPKVSIVTPVYNASPYIERTIESVKRQTFTDWQYVVVDDGSIDDSGAKAARCAASDSRISLIRQANSGAAAARNNGIAASHSGSTYLYFLDADDTVQENFLEVMTAYLDSHPEVGLAYCGYELIDEHDRPIETREGQRFAERFVPATFLMRRLPEEVAETPLEALASYHDAIPSTCLIRRAIFERTLRWRKIGISEDKDLLLQMALVAPVHFVPKLLVRYRKHSTNLTRADVFADLKQLHRLWWAGDWLSDEQRRRVRRALVFDKWVAAILLAEAVAQAASRGDFRRSLSLAHLAAKRLAASMVLGLRLALQETSERGRSWSKG